MNTEKWSLSAGSQGEAHTIKENNSPIARVLPTGEPSIVTVKRARLMTRAPELLASLKAVCEHGNLMLAKSGAAGHRYSESAGEWVCDPWTQTIKDAKALIAAVEKETA